MFPQTSNLELNNNSAEEGTLKPKKTFLFDFSKGDFVLQDGKLVTVEDIEAIKIYIQKALKTERFRFKIYDKEDKESEYGVTIEDLIVGHDYPQSFIEAELKREITTSLLKNDLIESLSEWKIEKNNPLLNINFKVNLKDGNTFEQEMNF